MSQGACRSLDAEQVARSLQYKVLKQTGVKLRVGISSNKILAKMATRLPKIHVQNREI